MVKKRKTPTRKKKAPSTAGVMAELKRLSAVLEQQREAEERAIPDEAYNAPTPAGAANNFGLLYTARRTAEGAAARDARITIRLHPNLRDLLIVAARRENRTLSQLVELVLIDYARGAMKRLDDAELRALGWDDNMIKNLASDPHPFARDLYNRLTKGY